MSAGWIFLLGFVSGVAAVCTLAWYVCGRDEARKAARARARHFPGRTVPTHMPDHLSYVDPASPQSGRRVYEDDHPFDL